MMTEVSTVRLAPQVKIVKFGDAEEKGKAYFK